MSLSPKTRWNLFRIIPFGIIWAVVGALLLVSDILAIGDGPIPEGAIYPNVPVFIFALLATFIAGNIVGAFEVLYGNRLFQKASLAETILYKFILYLMFFLLLAVIVYPIAAIMELDTNLSDPEVWRKFRAFWNGSAALWSTVLQLGFSLLLSLLYAAVSENLGHSVLKNFFTGKYHRPKEEERIFLFLDMYDSTTIAEDLGHIRYFEFLRHYYDDLADAIIQHEGEVYQYVGDEIVITWTRKKGLRKANCVGCFFAMQSTLDKRVGRYQRDFGHVPRFKGGMHLGVVTTGEVGALKKEIVYTGDVLNTAARIQGLCKTYAVDLLISEDLADNLPLNEGFELQSLGSLPLKGKKEEITVFSLKNS